MLDIGGNTYIIDLEALEGLLASDSTLLSQEMEETEEKTWTDASGKTSGSEFVTRKYTKGKEIDASKYEVVRMLFEVILTFNEDFDDALGFDNCMAKTPLPFKLSFNTLLNYGVLKEVEE